MAKICPICKRNPVVVVTVVGRKKEFPYCQYCSNEAATKSEKDRIKEQKKYFKDNLVREMLKRGVAQKDINCSFDNYKADSKERKENLRLAKMACFNMKSSVFAGEPGRGKTHLSVAVFREWLLNCQFPVYKHWDDIIKVIRERYRFNDADYLITKICRERILIIDDLLAGRMTDDVLNIAHKIIDGRIRNNVITLITTNYDKDSISKIATNEDPYVGKRLGSRFGALPYITFGGNDYRLE